MEGLNILVTGSSGYLGKALVAELQHLNTVIPFIGDVRSRIISSYEHTEDIDMLIHLASPIDNTDPYKTATTIIEGTVNMTRLAKQLNARLVFASTLGVIHDNNPENIYCTSKLAMENYIRCVYNNYIILRIPRVYSKCRQKGLIKLLYEDKVPDKDMNKIIKYITLQDFVSQTLSMLDNFNTIHEYEITQKRSIRGIRQWLGI